MSNLSKIKIQKLRKTIKEFKKDGNVDMVLRVKVIIAYLKHNKVDKISAFFDVSKRTIERWIKEYESNGIDGLIIKPRSGRPPKINQDELAQLREMIEQDQERVWVARHVFNLIVIVFSVIYSVKYIPELLKRIGLSFHKAIHYLVKKNEEKRSEWIKERLPKIYEEHIQDGWRIFFQDEVGFQTEGTLSCSWGPRGKAIVVNNKGRHGRVNLMGVYEVGSGTFFYKLTFFQINSLRFKRFLCCLKNKFKQDKFIIIADNASFHKAKWFTKWWSEISWLKIEFLPAYSPDFNPIERLWKWIKQEYTHNKCWASKKDLRTYLASKLLEMTGNVLSYIGTMRQELLRLKVAFDHHSVPFMWESHLPQAS